VGADEVGATRSRTGRNDVTDGNGTGLGPEKTVDRLEEEAMRTETHHAKGLGERPADRDDTPEEPAFDQDKDVQDLPGGAGEGGGSAPEPTD
jgi:hypothetical protein